MDNNRNFLKLPKDELVELFVANLLKTNRSFNFFVDWSNIEAYKKFDIELNAMSVLIRSKDFDNDFRKLLKKLPSVVATFPLLFALSRQERESIWKGKESLLVVNDEITDDGSIKENNLEFVFSEDELSKGLTDDLIDRYLFFFKKMGLKHLFLNLAEKSIVDYVIGVLVGLDTNGRKNRSGKAFELACYPIISEICSKYGIKLLEQKKFKVLREQGFEISKDVAERKADFILVKDNIVLNIEVNFFNGNGSKPEEIIDSYINRERDLSYDDISFALITDGEKCWGNDTKSQLLKGFRNISYILNYNLAKQGMLEEVILEVFHKNK